MEYEKKISKHRLQTFIFIVATIFLTTIVLSTILYFNFTSILKKNLYSSTKENLHQVSYSIKSLSENADTVLKQLVSDYEVKEYLFSQNLDQIGLYNCRNLLESYRITYPFIQSIYLINSSGEIVALSETISAQYTEDDFFDQGLINLIRNTNFTMLTQPIARTVKTRSLGGGEVSDNVYTFILKSNYLQPSDIKNTLVLNVSAQWLNDTIDYIDSQSESDKKTVIIDMAGDVVFSTDKNDFCTNILNEKYTKDIFEADELSGYFVSKNSEGINVFTVFVWSKYYNWCCISSMPYNEMIGDIIAQQRITIVISFIILLVSIIFIVFLSKKINLPIKQAYETIVSIEADHKHQNNLIKNTVLLSLLNGQLHKNNYALVEKYQSDGNTSIDLNTSMIIFILLIDKYSDFCKTTMHSDKENICSQLNKIAVDTLKPLQTIEVINGYGDKFIMLGNYRNEEMELEEIQKELVGHLKEFQNSVYQTMGIGLTISVSEVAHNYLDLPIYYDDTINLCKYRFVLGHKSILFPCDFNEYDYNDNEISYSVLNDKPLIESIMSRRMDETQKAYSKIIADFKTVPLEMYRHLLNQLFFEIRFAFKSKISGKQALDGQLTDFFNKLQTIETLSEAETLFYKFFGVIIAYLDNEESSEHNETVEKTMAFIDENYHLNSLSATLIADEIHISAAYLGKLFKQYANTSIPKYINDTRLKKSKELLSNTKMSINEISEAAGFANSSYFYSVFKRELGITPNQFRNNLEK